MKSGGTKKQLLLSEECGRVYIRKNLAKEKRTKKYKGEKKIKTREKNKERKKERERQKGRTDKERTKMNM